MEITKQCDNCANRDICKYKAVYDKLCETVTDALRHNWMITDLPDGAPGIVNMSEIPQFGVVVVCGHRTPHGFASGGGGWGYCGVSSGGRDDNMSRFSPGNFSLQFFPGDQGTVDKYN